MNKNTTNVLTTIVALLGLMVVSLYFFGPRSLGSTNQTQKAWKVVTTNELPCGKTISLKADEIIKRGTLCPAHRFCQEGQCVNLAADYCLHHDGEVAMTDKNSEKVFCAQGLMWSPTNADGLSWASATQYCHNLNYLGFSNWRLPSKTELEQVYQDINCKNCIYWDPYCCSSSAKTYPDNYWTGDEYKNPYAWYVTCSNGIARNYDKTHLYSVRCVRK